MFMFLFYNLQTKFLIWQKTKSCSFTVNFFYDFIEKCSNKLPTEQNSLFRNGVICEFWITFEGTYRVQKKTKK